MLHDSQCPGTCSARHQDISLTYPASLPAPLPCSATETLDRDDKFFCDTCCCLQEAQKRMKIKQLPQCLCLHLKRFKYIESLARWAPWSGGCCCLAWLRPAACTFP